MTTPRHDDTPGQDGTRDDGTTDGGVRSPMLLSTGNGTGASVDRTSVDRTSRDGDEAFQRFYRHEHAPAVRLAWMLTGDRSVAEDLAQDAFVRLYRHGGAVDRPAALLRTILVNVCRSWHRSRQRAQLRLVRHGPLPDALDPFARELDDALRRLPYEQRSVVVLRYWLGLTEAEIATTLNCRPGTVKSRHARALRAPRRELP